MREKLTKMIKFRQKQYTIQEGHYTGPKDLKKIPSSFEVIGKSTIGGSAAGAIVGGILGETGIIKDTGIMDGAKIGGKTGFVTGIVAKFLLNFLHKPLKKVEFQEVDKLIRARFGIFRVSGFTAGDTRARRQTVSEKFGMNDRDITSYKISFCIQDNKITMYTLGITNEDLDKLNDTLDYYCKKYFGMEYTAAPINTRENSYSVNLVFTNYKAISDFIVEVSEVLGYKINLLDSNSLLEIQATKEREKQFSIPTLDRYDKIRVLSKAMPGVLKIGIQGPKMMWTTFVTKVVSESLKTMSNQELAKYILSKRKDLGNSFLKDSLKKLGFIEGHHFTEGVEGSETNIRLDRGLFIMCTLSSGKNKKLIDGLGIKYEPKNVSGKVTLWTWPIEGRSEFNTFLQNLIHTGIKPNIYIG